MFILSKPDMKIPSDITSFMRNRKNKTRLLEFMQQVIVEDKEKLINRVIYFSGGSHCFKITSFESSLVSSPQSNYEEADTKLVAFVKSYLDITIDINSREKLMVRSPSGDILLLFVLRCSGSDILIDNGHGNSSKIIDLTTALLSPVLCLALSGIHRILTTGYLTCVYKRN